MPPLDTPAPKALVFFSSLFELLWHDACIELNRFQHTAEGKYLLPKFSVTWLDATTRDLLVLLDSRAQDNPVCRDILDPSLFQTSAQSACLKVANGTSMIGGTEEANLSLHLLGSRGVL